MVGAGRSDDCSRLTFSNYGQRVDAQGWGHLVYTTGNGDIFNGGDPDGTRLYTAIFSGTSSASPCVVACIAVVQGVMKAHGRAPLTPAEAQYLLRLTGTRQRDSPSPGGDEWGSHATFKTERIGNRPNLRTLIPAAMG